jgi:hypothetical protein
MQLGQRLYKRSRLCSSFGYLQKNLENGALLKSRRNNEPHWAAKFQRTP